MKSGIKNHPAYLWGRIIRKRRLAKKITAREMAEHLKIEPAKYAEIEHGILKWLTPEVEIALILNLRSPTRMLHDHNYLFNKLKFAKLAKPKLNCLGDIFTKEEILPLWPLKKNNGQRMNIQEMEEMVDFILLPLNENEN